MKECKFKFALGVLVLWLVAAINSFAVQVEPFYFEGVDADQQINYWQDLMKYKLWGTGVDDSRVGRVVGVAFYNNLIFIDDSLGYSGSAKGSFFMRNQDHSIGGPLAFAGDYIGDTGNDNILTGPSHFGGGININSNGRANTTWHGNVCSQTNVYNNFDQAQQKGGAVKTCEESDVPSIDFSLDVPEVDWDGFTFSRTITGDWIFNSSTNEPGRNSSIIDIPAGLGYYDILVTGNLDIKDGCDTLIVNNPNNRNVRIFIKGSLKIAGARHNIVVYDNKGLVSNADYGGNLLIYTPNNIDFPSQECMYQGTYMSGGTISFMQHYHFAGQLLAKEVIIDAEFMAGDFRYVPFDPAKLKIDRMLYEDHQDVGDTAWLFLTQVPPTNVPFRYCFEFPDSGAVNTAGSKFAHRDDLVDADIPLCANGDTVRTRFDKGKTTLTNPIILHAYYDALVESKERFYIRVCDIEAAVYADGDRTDNCTRLPLDIANVLKNPIGLDFAVTGFMNDPLVLDSFPAMKPDSTLLDDYSVRIDTLVSVGTLTFEGAPVQVGQVIASADLSKLVYKGKDDEWGYPYDYLSYSIVHTVGSETSVSDFNYHLIINLVSVIYPVNENSDKGTFVGQLETDMTTPKFTMVDETGTFVIDSTKGIITVAADSSINYEAKDMYFVEVTITSGSASKTVVVQIAVVDVNDPPAIRDTVMSVRENKPVGTDVGKMNLFDEDGPNSGFRQNSFSLVGGDSSLFSIEAETGIIKTRAIFDYEALEADHKFYTVQVQVIDNDGYKSIAEVKILIENEVETSVIVVTHAESGNGAYDETNPQLPIKVNDKTVTLSWTGDGIPQPDTTLKRLHEGYNVVTLYYYDKTKDAPATKDVTLFVSTKTPEVDVTTKVDVVEAFNIYTVVEQPAEGDTSFYVNKKENDLSITVKNPVLDSTYTDSTCNYTTTNLKVSSVPLDTLKSVQSAVKSMQKISAEKIMLNEMPSGKVKRTPYNDSLVLVSYKERIGSDSVTVTYVLNEKGDVVGDKMKISYETKIDGKTVTMYYEVDAFTGEKIEPESGAAYMVEFSYTDKNNVTVTIAYAVDSEGRVVKDADKNVGYEVGYTYVNEFGNTAFRSIYITVDLVAPKVKILSPHTDDVIFANYTDVKWTVDQNNGKGPQEMDSLKVQGLNKGGNTIVRAYRDKAGNSSVDTVYVIMKDAKDVDISVVTPVTLVTQDKTDEYYAANEPEKGQKFAVTIYNSKTGKEVETLRGGDFKTKEGSGDVPYPGLDGHLGPTLAVDTKLPTLSAVGGLATLDDLVGKDGLVSREGVESANGEKLTVDDYLRNHCTAQFQSDVGSDISKAALFHTVMTVKIWVYTTLGNFVDYFTFDQELDDPEYTNDAGVMTLYFEQKPDRDGYVRTADGRLYGTSAYLYKTEVTLKSELQCDLPPLSGTEPANKMGAVRKVSEDLLKPFGYKRPENK